MKVMNIGIIIKTDQGDTFPVALTPQMVGVIQNLLTQIPMLNKAGGLVDPSGKKIQARPSIPIIPRQVEFDWEAAYIPMEKEEELRLMEALQEKYDNTQEAQVKDEVGDSGNKVAKLHPDRPGMLEDPDNPFNMELEAKGTANKGMTDEEVKDAMSKAEGKNELEVTEENKNPKQQDCTVEVDSLGIGADIPQPGE